MDLKLLYSLNKFMLTSNNFIFKYENNNNLKVHKMKLNLHEFISIQNENENEIKDTQPLKKIKYESHKNEMIVTSSEKNIHNDNNNNNNNNNKFKTQVKDKFWFPKEFDSLFWILFLILYGQMKYELSNKTPAFVLQKKIEWIEEIKKNKEKFKYCKLDTITNIENNLSNESKINIKTFGTILSLNNLNYIIVFNSMYYLMINDETKTINKIIRNESKYGFLETKIDELNSTIENKFKLSSLEKPIKAISSYKSAELIDFAVKLNINITKNENKNEKEKNIIKKNKTELYDEIYNVLQNNIIYV